MSYLVPTSEPDMKGGDDSSESEPRERSRSASKTRQRASRAGSRSVSTLSAAQLERKRANDRDAQRAIRQRTKEHIESLEKRIAELTSQDDTSRKLNDALKRIRELEVENAALKTRLGVVEDVGLLNAAEDAGDLQLFQHQVPSATATGPATVLGSSQWQPHFPYDPLAMQRQEVYSFSPGLTSDPSSWTPRTSPHQATSTGSDFSSMTANAGHDPVSSPYMLNLQDSALQFPQENFQTTYQQSPRAHSQMRQISQPSISGYHSPQQQQYELEPHQQEQQPQSNQRRQELPEQVAFPTQRSGDPKSGRPGRPQTVGEHDFYQQYPRE